MKLDYTIDMEDPQTNQAMGPVQASPNWGNNQ